MAEDDARKQRLAETNAELASSFLQRGQLEFAKERLDKALAADPNHSQANNIMALLQWRFKDYEAAERYFQKAVHSRENNSEAQNNFGAFLCERGRVEEAEKLFKRAVANPLYKTPAIAYENAGLCYANRKMYAQAEPFFREALQSDPRRPPSLFHMARISFDAGRTLAARGFIQRYLEATEDTPESLILAVQIERLLGHKNDEASYALRLRSKFPTSPEALKLQKPVDKKG